MIMKFEFSKKMKIITFSAVAVAAVALGLFLECCDKKEFMVTEVPAPSELPEDTTDYHYDEKGRLDINTATAEEFQELKGIGEKLAERIITYRNEHGAFMAVEELTLVSGIGESLMEDIMDEICVR